MGIAVAMSLIVVSGLWIVFCFSTPVSDVHPYAVVARAPFTPAPAPIADALAGAPPGSSAANPLPSSDSIRVISVRPGNVSLVVGGVTTRSIPLFISSSITLATIATAVDDPGWIQQPLPGSFVLRAGLVLHAGIGLVAAAPATSAVHLLDAPGVFIGITDHSVSTIQGVTVDVQGAPVRWGGPLRYRPFLVFDKGAAVTVADATLDNLGWDWNQSYGISWMRSATGSLENSTVDGNFIGVYCQQVRGLVVAGNHIAHSHLYGIDPHTDSTALSITGNTTMFNAAHGIILSKGVTSSTVAYNHSSYNGENGIVMDAGSNGNRVFANISTDNVGDGLVLTDSVHTTIEHNTFDRDRIGILSISSTPTGQVMGNTVHGDRMAEKGIDAPAAANDIAAGETGVVLRPPPSWHWIITWVLWPLVALLFLVAFVLRRRELATGWRAAQIRQGLPDTDVPLSWRARSAGNQLALTLESAEQDAHSPVALLPPVPFVGPPPPPVATAPLAVEIAPDGAEILPTGDESGAPPGDRRFRPDVQGLRALAVALVVLYHAGVPRLTGGYVGVDVFFVISGFVITGLLLRERSNARSTSLVSFYARRAKRILPAATLVIVATVLASYHWLGFLRGAQVAGDSRWASVFLENIHAIAVGTDYFGATQATSPLLHYWSLAVEEQFYLVFPLLFLVTAALVRNKNLRSRLVVVLGIIIAGSLALSVLQTHSSPVTAYYSPLTRAWELALGGFVACAGPLLRRLNTRAAGVLSWLGLAGVLIAGFAYTGATAYPGYAVVLPVGATALVIAAGFAAPRFGAELVLGRLLVVKLGDISYSLYLWHFPVLVIAAEAATHPLSGMVRAELVGLAVLLSIATYAFLENPVRHAKTLGARPSRSIFIGLGLIVASLLVATALISVPGATTGTGSGATRGVPQSASLATIQAEVAAGAALTKLPATVVPPIGYSGSYLGNVIPANCSIEHNGQATLNPCNLGDPTSSHTIVLLGDSQASMWAEGFDRMAKSQHLRLVLLAKNGCPPWLTSYPTTSGAPFPQCDTWHRFVVQEINALHPSTVIATGGTGVSWTPSGDQKAIIDLVHALAPSKARVAILSDMSWYPPVGTGTSEPPDCLIQHPNQLSICNLDTRTWRRTFATFRTALSLGATRSGAAFVNLDPLYCTTRVCPVIIAGHQVYFDGHHMMPNYGSYIAPALETLLQPVLPA